MNNLRKCKLASTINKWKNGERKYEFETRGFLGYENSKIIHGELELEFYIIIQGLLVNKYFFIPAPFFWKKFVTQNLSKSDAENVDGDENALCNFLNNFTKQCYEKTERMIENISTQYNLINMNDSSDIIYPIQVGDIMLYCYNHTWKHAKVLEKSGDKVKIQLQLTCSNKYEVDIDVFNLCSIEINEVILKKFGFNETMCFDKRNIKNINDIESIWSIEVDNKIIYVASYQSTFYYLYPTNDGKYGVLPVNVMNELRYHINRIQQAIIEAPSLNKFVDV